MRVAVIGGGIAGLSAAHELLRRGADPVLFEACARAGGKVGTRNERGYLSEDGPNFLARPLDALLDASGLRPEVVTPRPPMTRWIHLDGRVLRAPGLSLLARAGLGRALLEPLFAKPLRDDMPLGEFLERRLGRRAGGLAATVMSAGVYAGDPASLSARDAFPSLGALAERGSLIVNAFRRPEAPRSGHAAPQQHAAGAGARGAGAGDRDLRRRPASGARRPCRRCAGRRPHGGPARDLGRA